MKTCAIDGCETSVKAKGLCRGHYQRALRTGDPGLAEIRSRRDHSPGCVVELCDKPYKTLGYCNAHYLRFRKYGDALAGPGRGNLKRRKHSAETKKKISENNKTPSGSAHQFFGKYHTDEARAKISAAKLGKPLGPQPSRYAQNPGYMAVHNWMRRHHKKTGACEACNAQAKSPRHTHWANISGDYQRNRSDYWELCVMCHKVFDYLKITATMNADVLSALKAKVT